MGTRRVHIAWSRLFVGCRKVSRHRCQRKQLASTCVHSVHSHGARNARQKRAPHGSALNEEFRASIPRSIAEALPTSSQTFYWDPRNDKAPGVLSTDVPMPSPVTRHASGRRPPPHYVSRNGDAGDAHQALVLSAQDVAKLLGFEHQLPPAPKAKQAGWAAKLIQPNVVSLFFKCIHAVSPLPTGWKRPDGSQ